MTKGNGGQKKGAEDGRIVSRPSTLNIAEGPGVNCGQTWPMVRPCVSVAKEICLWIV
jgi:hypothetical protein